MDGRILDLIEDPQLRSLFPPPSPSEVQQLEELLVRDGCQDPLKVMAGTKVLVDGYSSYRICKQHNIPFGTIDVSLASRDEAKIWKFKRHRARRNLTPGQWIEIAAKLRPAVERMARTRQGQRTDLCPTLGKGEPIHTDDTLAKLVEMSAETFRKGLYVLNHGPEDLRMELLSGKKRPHRAYLELHRQEQQAKDRAEEEAALREATGEGKSWNVTALQDVVPCDIVMTDPPYGILDVEFDRRDDPVWLEKLWRDFGARWAKSGAGFIVVFTSQSHYHKCKQWLDESLAGDYEYERTLLWVYHNISRSQGLNRIPFGYEPILIYRRKGCERVLGLGRLDASTGLVLADHFDVRLCSTNMIGVDRKIHETPKPILVMRWLMNLITRPGDLIADPFCGSGTTLIAALQLGRRAYGIEIRPECIELARRRIAAYGRPDAAIGDEVADFESEDEKYIESICTLVPAWEGSDVGKDDFAHCLPSRPVQMWQVVYREGAAGALPPPTA